MQLVCKAKVLSDKDKLVVRSVKQEGYSGVHTVHILVHRVVRYLYISKLLNKMVGTNVVEPEKNKPPLVPALAPDSSSSTICKLYVKKIFIIFSF